MTWLKRFLSSNIGLKALMAVSGLLLVGFVLAHMAGNLQIFIGEDAFNHYGEMLQGQKELVWILRLGLLTAVVAHIYSAVVLTMRAKAARPQGYKQAKWLTSSYAVRTMRVGGIILLLFIVYHLLHLTNGAVHPDFTHYTDVAGGGVSGDAFRNVVIGFSNPIVVAVYVVAQIFLGMHLAHGVWSLLRTLGLDNPRYDRLVRSIAKGVGALVAVGNCSIPIAVLAGVVG